MRGLVIIPTYNEIYNVERIINAALAQDERLDVLIVDDNSPDGTGVVVEKMMQSNSRIKILKREKKSGLGPAYVAGFRKGLEEGYDYLFEMDADFSHDPVDLSRMMQEIEHADLVIGSRYCQGINVVNWPIMRLILSYGASKYVRFVTRMPIKDPTGGFKCFRREVLEKIELEKILSDGYSFQVEMNYRAWLKGFRITEMPIIFYERRDGQSKMSKKIVYEAIFMVWQLRLLALLHRL